MAHHTPLTFDIAAFEIFRLGEWRDPPVVRGGSSAHPRLLVNELVDRL